MAPSNEVVDLLSSDEEEEEHRGVAAEKKVNSVNETIDLCESSEDEEDEGSNNAKLRPAAVYKKTKGNGTLVQTSKASGADKTGLSFREASKSSGFARKVSPSAEQQQAEPLTNAAFYLDRAKQAAAARRTRELDSDDDDDDDELFSFDTGLTRKKQPPQETSAAPRNPYQKSHSLQETSGNDAAAAQKPAPKNSNHTIRRKSDPGAATAYAQEQRKPPAPAHRKSAPPVPQAPNDDDDSEDDDDDLFNFSTGLLRPPASSRRTEASSAMSQQIVVTNPYLPSKPRASFAAATTPASRPFPYPKLTERAKQYPDERARFLLAFWRYARANCTRRSFERPKLDAVAKRVVRLAVGTDHPVRSLEELVRTSGGSATGSSSVNAYNKVRDDFRQELAQGGFDRLVTPVVTAPTTSTSSSSSSNQRYYSISEACLVTLLMHAETARGPGGTSTTTTTTDELLPAALSEKENWMALVDMIPAIDRKLHPFCPGHLTRRDDPDWGAEHYLQQSTRSMEFLQVSKLESKDVGPFIKRHSVKGSIHYELLPAGYERAMRIRTRQFPEPEGHYRCSKIRSLQDVDPKYPNICLGVDMREGGGGAKTLHQMCNTLEMMKCPYFVGSLSIGDYVFFTSKGRGRSGGRMDYLCPILVERKSIQDVAMSIHDGRWTSQKQRMYKAQNVFGYVNCRMVYIIEGNENKQTVNGGYVGARWYNVDKEKLHKEIENLEKEGFDVLRTTSVENSMMELSRWVSRVARKVAEGTMKAEYTYAEFKDQVAKIPKKTDFSRLAKYYVEQKAERAAAASAAAADDDSDIEVWSNAGNHNAAASRGKKPAPSAGSQEQKRSAKKRKSSVKCGGHGPDDYTAKKRKSNDNGGLVGGGGGGDGDIDYSAWETKALKAECEAVGLKKSGTREECIQLLKGPRPPAVWLERKRMNEYVPPRHNVAATALLVALHLHEQASGPGDPGMTKDELYVKAESLNITKVSICSVCCLLACVLFRSSAMISHLVVSRIDVNRIRFLEGTYNCLFCGHSLNDSLLLTVHIFARNRRTTQTGPYHYTGWASMAPLLEGDPALVVKRKKRYKLTTSGRIAGVPFAEAMHSWCHEHGNCPCQDHDYYG